MPAASPCTDRLWSAAARRAIVGPAHVLVDAELRAPFETDWTRRFGGPALLVVRPGSTDEVAEPWSGSARPRGVGIVVQGGNTGLVGGGGAAPGRRAGSGVRPVVVLSTRPARPGWTPSTRWPPR